MYFGISKFCIYIVCLNMLTSKYFVCSVCSCYYVVILFITLDKLGVI